MTFVEELTKLSMSLGMKLFLNSPVTKVDRMPSTSADAQYAVSVMGPNGKIMKVVAKHVSCSECVVILGVHPRSLPESSWFGLPSALPSAGFRSCPALPGRGRVICRMGLRRPTDPRTYPHAPAPSPPQVIFNTPQRPLMRILQNSNLARVTEWSSVSASCDRGRAACQATYA